MSFSQLDYCQYLLSSPNNYTLNNLANHLENVSHDTINRYLTKENFTSESLRQNVKKDIQISENSAIILFNQRTEFSFDKNGTCLILLGLFLNK